MKTPEICKRIDLMRIKSIIDDEPKHVIRKPYNFDEPIKEKG